MQRLTREHLAALVAADLPAGAVVNLGIGMPTLVTDRLDPARGVQLHSENGILGMRLLQAHETADGDLINASKQSIALTEGAAIFDHVYSFSIMRGGHIDITVLGAFEVSCDGDLANWSLGEDDPMPSVGGAMDLAVGARGVWVMMETLTREGRPRLRSRCTLPLTGAGVVGRVYADIGIFEVRGSAFVPIALVAGLPPSELSRWIDAPLRFDDEPRVLHVPPL
ncbi:3-oxoadipate CoA-transferase [Achromobacter denitrificans]|uniref:CoA-transferase n=1 Tax=Achromobacter denitrificans TaxID=32002 RepID=UPI000B4D2438|nr:CoA-transferase [Achromobacter denitrificans]ASC65818.1 3-oxoadipate CoA-transferase [Achromobacter denitrificans]